MPGRAATLTIQVLADVAKAQAGLGKVGDETQTLGGKARGMVPSVAAAGAAVAGFAVIAGAAAMAAAEDAAEHDRLLQAYEAAGAATGDYSAEIDKAIESGQSLAFTDTEIRDALVPLIGATGDAEQASKDLALAQDLARLKGISLESAATAVAKAQAGSATALAKMTGQTTEGKTATDILAEAQRKAAGQAEVYGASTAGQAAAMKIGFSELTETVGMAFLPIIQALVPVLQSVAGWIAKNSGVVKVAAIAIGALTVAVFALSLGVKAYSVVQSIMTGLTAANTAATKGNTIATIAHLAKLAVLKAATVAYTAVQWLMNAALTANPIGIVVVAIAALVAGLVLAYNKSETFRRIVDAAFKAVSDTVRTVVGFITGAWEGLTDILLAPFQALMDFIEGARGAVGSFLEILPGEQAAAPAGMAGPMAMGRAGPTPYATGTSGSVPGSSGLGLKVSGNVTVTHKISDPGGALASLPGGAAAVARELAKASDATGLYRNLQHAAGLR